MKILDLMEYTSDALARAAYIGSKEMVIPVTDDLLTGGTPSASGQYADFGPALACDDLGDDGHSWYSDANNGWWQYDFGAGVTKIVGVYSIYVNHDNWPVAWTFLGSNNGSDWTTLDTRTAQNPTTKTFYSISNTTAYRYYRFNITAMANGAWGILTEIEMFSVPGGYSEGSIKTEGSYALKAIAPITTSLNGTLTRAISPVIDLSAETIIKFDMCASRTGSNIKLGIHDSGGTITEITPNILVADTWQTILWDIRTVSAANRDAIDQIIITIVNADAANTFYIDNMYATTIKRYLFDRKRSRSRTTGISQGA